MPLLDKLSAWHLIQNKWIFSGEHNNFRWTSTNNQKQLYCSGARKPPCQLSPPGHRDVQHWLQLDISIFRSCAVLHELFQQNSKTQNTSSGVDGEHTCIASFSFLKQLGLRIALFNIPHEVKVFSQNFFLHDGSQCYGGRNLRRGRRKPTNILNGIKQESKMQYKHFPRSKFMYSKCFGVSECLQNSENFIDYYSFSWSRQMH